MKRDILKNFLVENRVCNIPYKLYSIIHAACCWFPHSQRWNYLDFKGDDHPSGLNFYDQEVLFNSGLSIYNFGQSYYLNPISARLFGQMHSIDIPTMNKLSYTNASDSLWNTRDISTGWILFQ